MVFTVTLTLDVVQNALWTAIAIEINLVSITNVWIRVLELVVKTRNVKSQTMFLHVTACLDTLETLFMHVFLYRVRFLFYLFYTWIFVSEFFTYYSSFSMYKALPEPVDPCHPSPCGPYSKCRTFNGHAVCTCLDICVGSPPNCHPECIVSSDCRPNKACVNQKCQDPCPGMCGVNAQCQVVNHNPICSCYNGYTGDPFVRCFYDESKFMFIFRVIFFFSNCANIS